MSRRKEKIDLMEKHGHGLPVYKVWGEEEVIAEFAGILMAHLFDEHRIVDTTEE